MDLIGAEYDFPQTKLSQQTETADQQEKSNHSELVKDQRADLSLQRLLDQAKDPDSEFVIENEVLQRKTRDNHGNPYTQIVLPENRHNIAEINQMRVRQKAKDRHDKEATEKSFSIGDKVLVFSPVVTGKLTAKLQDCWQGPYEIIGKVSPVTYLVEMPEKKKNCSC